MDSSALKISAKLILIYNNSIENPEVKPFFRGPLSKYLNIVGKDQLEGKLQKMSKNNVDSALVRGSKFVFVPMDRFDRSNPATG
jgi:hypothetical protein